LHEAEPQKGDGILTGKAEPFRYVLRQSRKEVGPWERKRSQYQREENIILPVASPPHIAVSLRLTVGLSQNI